MSNTLSCRQVKLFEKLPYVKNAENTSRKSPRIVFSNVLGVFQANRSVPKIFTFSDFTFVKKTPKKTRFLGQNFRFFLKIFDLEISNFFCWNISRNLPTFQKSYSEHWGARFLWFWTYLGPSLKVPESHFCENLQKSAFTKMAICQFCHIRCTFFFSVFILFLWKTRIKSKLAVPRGDTLCTHTGFFMFPGVPTKLAQIVLRT